MKTKADFTKIPYVVIAPMLTYTGISSAVKLLILALCISFREDGLIMTNQTISEILNTTPRNIQLSIEGLLKSGLVENVGTKQKRILRARYEEICALIAQNLAHRYEDFCASGTKKPALTNEEICASLYKEDNNTDNNNDSKKDNKRSFYPPSLDDVQKYISEKGLSVEAMSFIEHYSKLGWKDVNGRPVRDWKKKLLTVWSKSNGYRKTIPNRQQPVEDFASQESKQGITIRV